MWQARSGDGEYDKGWKGRNRHAKIPIRNAIRAVRHYRQSHPHDTVHVFAHFDRICGNCLPERLEIFKDDSTLIVFFDSNQFARAREIRLEPQWTLGTKKPSLCYRERELKARVRRDPDWNRSYLGNVPTCFDGDFSDILVSYPDGILKKAGITCWTCVRSEN